MIGKKEIERLISGEMGITENGRKAHFIGYNHNKLPVLEIILESNLFNQYSIMVYSKDFQYPSDCNFDVVGIWTDRAEPFDLQSALKGNPVRLRSGDKAYVLGDLRSLGIDTDTYPLCGYVVKANGSMRWSKEGKASVNNPSSVNDILSMWKD